MRIKTLLILVAAATILYPSTMKSLFETGKAYSSRSLAESAGEFAGNAAGKVAGVVSAPYNVLPTLGAQAIKNLGNNIGTSVQESYQGALSSYKKAFQAAQIKERRTASAKIEKSLRH